MRSIQLFILPVYVVKETVGGKTRYLGHRYFQTVSFMMKATDVTIDPVFRNFSIYGLNKMLSYSPQKIPIRNEFTRQHLFIENLISL